MRELIIGPDSAGQRLDRYLGKLLPKAGKSLIQKSIRKKNVKLNGKKAEANAILKAGDSVRVFFSDETFDKLAGRTEESRELPQELALLIKRPVRETEDFIAINKPAGLLSQPDATGDPSVSEIAKAFKKPGSTFSPAPLNRLDRGTSGVVIIPKNYEAQRLGAERLREHKARKTYRALVLGEIREPGSLTDSLVKDTGANKVSLGDGGAEVRLSYRPVKSSGGYTLLEVDLITGKPHQIRAQLAKMGHPVLGDVKYGEKSENIRLAQRCGLKSPLLHAWRYALYNDDGTVLFEAEAREPGLFRKLENLLLGD